LVVEFFFDFDFLFSTIGGWRWQRCWLLVLNDWWQLLALNDCWCWLLRLSLRLDCRLRGLGRRQGECDRVRNKPDVALD
jgi:hypothetical protein